ncbi:putative alpha/beta hydrolase [Hasllibacter halocynthiae]|uniref:Putative alpha/beta hydrolase n=1 Tax=Hasllibacter halocynthiae TaxID=595589 RepID=A0A2T0X411_9RHOB|nr:alpha/beta fold hydrolase [Hasllibacter halocynthiae]PRY93679.1 putative alpha/beta hydrolase [Hasllibacter halocynthiae]
MRDHAGQSGSTEAVAFESEGNRLAGRLAHPAGPPRRVVVINGATGVPAGYYRAFADWLAETRQAAVLTWDYRDFGSSAVRPARESRARMSDWAVADQQAARDCAERRFPGLPIWVIGHSLGGLGLAYQAGLGRIERFVAVASGPVHISDHPWRYRPVAAGFWWGPAALAVRTAGYLPARLGPGADLPGGVFRQWRRWCTTRGFSAGDPALPPPRGAELTGTARFVVASDDDLCPPATAWRHMRSFPEARHEQAVLRPEAHGLRRIGHVAPFARASRAVWPEIVGL